VVDVNTLLRRITRIQDFERLFPNLLGKREETRQEFSRAIEQALASVRQRIRRDEQSMPCSVNGDQIEECFEYLRACKEITELPELHCQFEPLISECDAFLEQYCKQQEEQIRGDLDTIRRANLSDEESETVTITTARRAWRALCDLKRLGDKFPLIAQHSSCLEVVRMISGDLSERSAELKHEIDRLYKDDRNFESKLLELRAMRPLNPFVLVPEYESFTELYDKYYNLSITQTDEMSARLVAAIHDQDYTTAKDIVLQFKHETFTDRKVKPRLLRSLKTLQDEIRATVGSLQDDLDNTTDAQKNIANIVSALTKLSEAAPLQELVAVDLPINQFIDDTKSRLVQKLSSTLSNISRLFRQDKFAEAHKKLNCFHFIRQCLHEYADDPSLVQELTTLNEVVENQKKEVQERFRNMKIGQFSYDRPIDLYNRLYNPSPEPPYANSLWTSICEAITVNFRQAFESIANEMRAEEARKMTLECTYALRYVPPDLKERLEQELKDAQDKSDDILKVSKSDLQDILDRNDPDAICVKYRELKEQNILSLLQTVRNGISNNVRSLCTETTRKIDDKDMTDIVHLVLKMKRYAQHFSELAQKPAEEACNRVRQCFAASCDSLNQATQTRSRHFSSPELERALRILMSLVEQCTNGQVEVFTVVFPSFCECVSLTYGQLVEYLNRLQGEMDEAFDEIKGPNPINIKACNALTSAFDGLESFDNIGERFGSHTMRIPREFLETSQTHELSLSWKGCSVWTTEMSQHLGDRCVSVEQMNFVTETKKFNHKERMGYCSQLKKTWLIIQLSINVIGRSRARRMDRTVDDESSFSECEQACKTHIQRQLDSVNSVLLSETPRLVRARSANDFDSFNASCNLLEVFIEVFRNQSPAALPDLVHQAEQSLQQGITGLRGELRTKVQQLEAVVRNESTAEELQAAMQLILAIHRFAQNVIALETEAREHLNQFFQHIKGQRNGARRITMLASVLNGEPSGLGQDILANYSCFKSFIVSVFNDKTKTQDIDYVLANMCFIDGLLLDTRYLRKAYDEFAREYTRFLTKYLEPNPKFDDIMFEIGDIIPRGSKGVFDADARGLLPRLLAPMFCIWTLSEAEQYFDYQEGSHSYLRQPHPAQVVAIFCILGVGIPAARQNESAYQRCRAIFQSFFPDQTSSRATRTRGPANPSLHNCLVQIGTGEGKSVVLALTSATLALFGFEVNCACYSAYLSQRDFNEFGAFFTQLRVADKIYYGTFNQLCERLINEQGDIRELASQMILSGPSAAATTASTKVPKVLLIDEVDVFFKPDFYGQLYNPIANIRNDTVLELVNYIWESRGQTNQTVAAVKQSEAYQRCVVTFPGWEDLLDEAVKDMMVHVRSFGTPQYWVKDDKIVYKEQDGFSDNIVVGYRTLFAYFAECENGNISAATRDNFASINIRCGNFSYAEMPKYFDSILGVTGTLEHLSTPERVILVDDYNIGRHIYMPSVRDSFVPICTCSLHLVNVVVGLRPK
jgi:hypothetical protein